VPQHQRERLAACLVTEFGKERDIAAEERLEDCAYAAEYRPRPHGNAPYHSKILRDPMAGNLEGRAGHPDYHLSSPWSAPHEFNGEAHAKLGLVRCNSAQAKDRRRQSWHLQ
jgi:hypothetical protein